MHKVPLAPIKERVARGLITERKHPTATLWIYNYTPQCQFGRNWDEYTLMCRGLILDDEGNVMARPFPKFFNLGEHEDTIPNEPFTVNEKMDGSLGIMYWDSSINNYSIATRGSFTSHQAKVGTSILRKYLLANGYNWIDDSSTYLFEIIYPKNRIVINYGDAVRLVLLAVIDTDTGREDVPLSHVRYDDIVTEHSMPNINTPEDLSKLSMDEDVANREGFVVHFQSGMRLKLKFDEYVRLHRILTQISSKSIWELLRNGEPIEPILDNVPDEFMGFVRDTQTNLQYRYNEILEAAIVDFEDMPAYDTIREKAEYIKRQRYPTVNFMMMQGKPIDALIWKMIKPNFEQPFRVDADA